MQGQNTDSHAAEPPELANFGHSGPDFDPPNGLQGKRFQQNLGFSVENFVEKQVVIPPQASGSRSVRSLQRAPISICARQFILEADPINSEESFLRAEFEASACPDHS